MRARAASWRLGAAFLGIGVAAVLLIDLRLEGTWRGLYLLRDGWGVEISDDLFLGDEGRFLFGLDVRRGAVAPPVGYDGPRPALVQEWVAWDGTGWVRNLLPGGREIVTTFSRYVDREGRHPTGLFIGGRPPPLPGNEGTRLLNQSGMAYYDGNRWYHVWCNANEALATADGSVTVQTVDWVYRESEVVSAGPGAVALRSLHVVDLAGAELEVERHALFRAGEPYVLLAISISNRGSEAVGVRYGYGDEPWLGEYGSSEGNVGWVEGRLVEYEEGIDPARHAFAGYFDYGNEAIGSPHTFTNLANFVEWHPETRPSAVYFSNSVGQAPQEGPSVALAGNERAITLEWGPGDVVQGEPARIILAVGLAGDVHPGLLPSKPPVDFSPAEQALARR
ncbi:MAG: hypothetical protein AB1578_17565 [Thermodesulfobacteriota bacterium]